MHLLLLLYTDATECKEYNETVTYGQLCTCIRDIIVTTWHFFNLHLFLHAGLQMTAIHMSSSVVLATVSMETALMTRATALRTRLVFTVKLC